MLKRIIEEGFSVDELRQELRVAGQKESELYRLIKSKSLKKLYGKKIQLQLLKTKKRLSIDFDSIEDLASILSNIGRGLRKVK